MVGAAGVSGRRLDDHEVAGPRAGAPSAAPGGRGELLQGGGASGGRGAHRRRPSQRERRWCHDLYDKGLREFAFRNELEIPRSVRIDVPQAPTSSPATSPPPGLAVAVGGGKDSIVVVEALRSRRPLLVNVHGHPAARRTADAAGLDLVVLGRAVDPALIDLNRSGALNGHVPVTAIVSLLLVAAGFVHRYDTTVLSLERSVDEPTRRRAGVPGQPSVEQVVRSRACPGRRPHRRAGAVDVLPVGAPARIGLRHRRRLRPDAGVPPRVPQLQSGLRAA